ncbi:hypothetical protein ACHAXR_007044 [Thalassiosira sp. AJA248-18]
MISVTWLTGGLLYLLLLSAGSHAFVPSTELHSPSRKIAIQQPFRNPCQRLQKTSLNGDLFGLGKKENEEKSPQSDDASVPTRVLEIPVQSIKQGGLRFTLGLHLVGLQDKGTWKPNEASANVLDMYFKDNSAMFSLVLNDDAIIVDRYGKPSLAYVLQESLVLHNILDELNELCFSGDIEAENRLLRLEEPGDAIEKARSTLPARSA